MFCGLGEKEHTRFRKKKKEKKETKKEKNLMAAKSGFVGMKGYLETYNHVKHFLPYLCSFEWEKILSSFYAKLSGRFLGPKIKVTSLIASKFGTNKQFINFELPTVFYVATCYRTE